MEFGRRRGSIVKNLLTNIPLSYNLGTAESSAKKGFRGEKKALDTAS